MRIERSRSWRASTKSDCCSKTAWSPVIDAIGDENNDIDPEYGLVMGDYFEGFVKDEARTLGLTVDDVQNWQPKKTKKAKRSKAKSS